MFEIAAQLGRELDRGGRVAVVTVVAVHGSAPRTPGSAMAVTADGRAIGAISGGCVESEAYELARAALADGPSGERVLGLDSAPLAARLACGGTVGVLASVLEGDDAGIRSVLAAAERGEGAALRFSLASGAVEAVPPEGATRRDGAAFTLVSPRAPRMVIVGGVDFTPAVVDAGRLLGYRVTVVDARPVFATAERFPRAHEAVRAWPDRYLADAELGERDAVCVLTHEERFDVPALAAALGSEAGYVGAMGSRRVHERRLALLREAGVSEESLARLRAPIGLDLGGSTAAETAVAIAAEIVALRHGGSGAALSGLEGPIHRRA